MPLILSTKALPPKLKRHLFAADIGLVEYDAVKIVPAEVSFTKSSFENVIFTSQNAVSLAFEKHKLKFQQVFCVGEKTANLLQDYGVKPNSVSKNAHDLAQLILNDYPHLCFDFFCSAQRRSELPDLLNTHGIQLKEHHLYKSIPDVRIFKNDFDAVLCYSPMGVKAYYAHHDKQPLAICIGETTAAVAKEYTPEVLVANTTSLESVVYKSVMALK